MAPLTTRLREVYSMLMAPLTTRLLSLVGQRKYIHVFFTIYIIYNEQLKRQGLDSSPLKRAISDQRIIHLVI